MQICFGYSRMKPNCTDFILADCDQSVCCTFKFAPALYYLFDKQKRRGYVRVSAFVLLFLELDKETCWERRRNRTYDPEDQIGYFEGLAWPYYLHNLSLLRGLESQITFMNGADSMEANFCRILNIICQKLAKDSKCSSCIG